MRGELVKKDDKWYIKRIEEGDWETYYELHPDDVKQIKQDALVFDDIEARIKAWPDTPFTIYEKWEEIDGETKVTRYGKIKSVIEENNEKLQALQFLATQAQELGLYEISDEEIEEASKQINYGGGSMGWIKDAFKKGAKWYREQIRIRNEKK